jgi:hypothetical protein
MAMPTALARYYARHRTHTARPIVIRQVKTVKAKKHPRKGHGVGGLGGLIGGNRGKVMMGALAVGFIDKLGFAANLPKLPMLGEHGTIALALYLLGGKSGSGLISDACTAALVLSAYELGHTGSIVGGDYVAGAF